MEAWESSVAPILVWLYIEGWEAEALTMGKLYWLDAKGGGVGGRGGAILLGPPGEDTEVLEYFESGTGTEDAAVEPLLNGDE